MKGYRCVVASAIFGSRLDYCNALLVGISEANLDKPQHAQNTLTRIVTGTCRRDHISPVLADVHWLPIRARITYKIATLVFKMPELKQPMYLAELIEDYKPARDLRSTSRLLLKEPCVKTTTGQRSFHFEAAKIWNGLTDHIRSFEYVQEALENSFAHTVILHLAGTLFSAPTNSLAKYGVVKIDFTYLLTYLLKISSP